MDSLGADNPFVSIGLGSAGNGFIFSGISSEGCDSRSGGFVVVDSLDVDNPFETIVLGFVVVDSFVADNRFVAITFGFESSGKDFIFIGLFSGDLAFGLESAGKGFIVVGLFSGDNCCGGGSGS